MFIICYHFIRKSTRSCYSDLWCGIILDGDISCITVASHICIASVSGPAAPTLLSFRRSSTTKGRQRPGLSGLGLGSAWARPGLGLGRLGRPELLTVELPQSLEKQDEEIQVGCLVLTDDASLLAWWFMWSCFFTSTMMIPIDFLFFHGLCRPTRSKLKITKTMHCTDCHF